MRVVLVGLALGSAAAGAVFACGASAVGVDACDKIERARCGWVVACAEAGISLPVRRSESTSPVDDCYRYYADECLHGLVTTVAPTDDQVKACVNAIDNATDCTIVLSPETSDACAFLIPPDASPDADAGAE